MILDDGHWVGEAGEVAAAEVGMADQQVRDQNLESALFDLESDEEGTRRRAVFAAVKLGDRAIKLQPLLRRIDGQHRLMRARQRTAGEPTNERPNAV